jgi:hypothetical protein
MSELSPKEAGYAAESVGLSSVLIRLREAMQILSNKEGYEDLDEDEKNAIAEKAIALIPVNLHVRLPSGLNLEEPLRFNPASPVAILQFPSRIMGILDEAGVSLIGDLEVVTDSKLVDHHGMTMGEINIIRRVVPHRP